MSVAQDFRIEIPVLRITDQITKARQILRDDRFREIYVVNDEKKLLGYVDITDGLRVTATRSNVTVEGYVKDAAEVHASDPIEHIAREIKKFRTDSAAVVDEKRHITGGVLLSDLFPAIISRHEISGTVADCMSGNVVTAEENSPVQHIYTLIVQSGFSAFPVVRKKKLVGIVSRRDLLRSGRTRTARASAEHMPVRKIMTREVITLKPDDLISTAARLLVQHDVSRLPVMDGESVVGIVDRHDVLAGLA
ncbi:MAG: CBS domain-containing protein [Methanoregula sp.]|nr:MAG: CBS domain-containing protein [Methanoregula sp.]